MDDKEIMLVVIAMMVVVILSSFGLALWIVARLRRRSDQPLSQDMTGVIVVPVRQLKRTLGFLGHSANGISPRLELAPEGLRFKVFKPDAWAFAEIAEVDAPWLPFVTRLVVRNRSGARLYVDLADTTRARDLLRALPRSLPLTQRAIDRRDGVE